VIIGLSLVLPPPPRQRPRGCQYLTGPRNVGCSEAGSSPQPFRHIEMGDHPYPPEQVAHQLRSRAAHEAIRPGDLAFVVRGFRGGFGGQSLERDEGGGACALPLQKREGPARMLEPSTMTHWRRSPSTASTAGSRPGGTSRRSATVPTTPDTAAPAWEEKRDRTPAP
jgi:hypothetical protein